MKYAEVHLGKLIKKECQQLGILPTHFGKKIGLSAFQGTRIMKMKEVRISQLREISKVLKHDFFQYLLPKAEQDLALKSQEATPSNYTNEQVEQFQKRIADLEELNQLLREKVAKGSPKR